MYSKYYGFLREYIGSLQEMVDNNILTVVITKDITNVTTDSGSSYTFMGCNLPELGTAVKSVTVLVCDEVPITSFLEDEVIWVYNLDINKETVMTSETKSICTYLDRNREIIDKYVNYVKENNVPKEQVCYSGFLLYSKLEGTTKEGVSFSSSRVCREEVTKYLKERYF